jgi:uncharacterized protein with PQ loop repeat
LDPCVPDKPANKDALEAGNVLGYISSVLYIHSRMPQVWKNYKRQSVDGLSWQMFFCAFMGNFTTVLGIVMRLHGMSDFLEALPFLPGSAGTLGFDFLIMLQYFVYTRRAKKRRALRAALREELPMEERDMDAEIWRLLEDIPKIKPLAARGVHDLVIDPLEHMELDVSAICTIIQHSRANRRGSV